MLLKNYYSYFIFYQVLIAKQIAILCNCTHWNYIHKCFVRNDVILWEVIQNKPVYFLFKFDTKPLWTM